MKRKIATKTTYFSLFGNILLALIKAFAGIWGHSHALIADAIESTSDIFTSLILLLGIKYSNKPPDKNHPYGHGRIEPLISFFIVGVLIISALVIAYHSVKNILIPHKMPEYWTLFVLAGIILWKEISFNIVLKKSKETNSTSLRADAWHHRSDAITSVTAFIGISVALFFGRGYESADDWAALFAVIIILYNSYLLFRSAFGEIMDEHLYEEIVKQIREISLSVKGILGTEKCFIRKSGMKYHVDLHAIVNGNITVEEGHSLAHKLQETLKNEIENLDYISIHIEPGK